MFLKDVFVYFGILILFHSLHLPLVSIFGADGPSRIQCAREDDINTVSISYTCHCKIHQTICYALVIIFYFCRHVIFLLDILHLSLCHILVIMAYTCHYILYFSSYLTRVIMHTCHTSEFLLKSSTPFSSSCCISMNASMTQLSLLNCHSYLFNLRVTEHFACNLFVLFSISFFILLR